MRLILAAALLAAIALPAHAQRLDTRVREVWSAADGTTCRLNANPYVQLNETSGAAIFVQTPIDRDPQYSISFTMTFTASGGARAERLMFVPIRSNDRPPLRAARLLIDGEDSGVTLSLLGNYDHTERGYVTVPEPDRAETARRMLAARNFDFVIDEGGPSPRSRRFRFDAARFSEVAEILSLIRFSCAGDRAS